MVYYTNSSYIPKISAIIRSVTPNGKLWYKPINPEILITDLIILTIKCFCGSGCLFFICGIQNGNLSSSFCLCNTLETASLTYSQLTGPVSSAYLQGSGLPNFIKASTRSTELADL